MCSILRMQLILDVVIGVMSLALRGLKISLTFVLYVNSLSLSDALSPLLNLPGQHWYMDAWGPDGTPSLLHMNVYSIGFRDAMSQAKWLYHS